MPKNVPDNFADRVRAVVRAIPPGTTMTYSEVAQIAGNARAARAVARVMATNYDPSVPCHRVIRKDGTLGGYNRGGTAVKQQLLNQEQATSV